MSIKIIFCDIDFTLLNHNPDEFDLHSIEALKKAQKNGVLVYLATARPYDSIKKTGILDLFSPDGMVCRNGAVVFHKDEVIFKNLIPTKIVEKVIDVANEYGYIIEYCTYKGRYFTKKGDNFAKIYNKKFFEKPCEIKKFNGEEITALLMLAPDKYDKEIIKKLPPQIEYLRFDDVAVDIRYSRNNKGIGVDFAMKYLEISKNEALSIGDDYIDTFMFKNTGFSACIPGNNEDAKKEATHVAKPITEHGVKDALMHFGIIKNEK